MKIDRVILVSDNNPLYYDFWEPLSLTYKQKFNIEPTLVFFGSQNELSSAGLSDKYGKIILADAVVDVPKWQYTWALFYYTKFFPNDTIVIIGIDQIPLGTHFIKDVISSIEDDKYVMLIDDCYSLTDKKIPKWDVGGFCPSAYHIAKGSTFIDFYNFEESFESEIRKVSNCNIPTLWSDGWGTDEAYSSHILYKYKDRERIEGLGLSSHLLTHRIECHRTQETVYDTNALKNNFYVECHSCRPYKNHKDYIDKMIDLIPIYS